VPTFVDRAVARGQSGGSPTVVNLSFLDRVTKYNYNYKVEEDEVGGTCSTNGGEKEHVYVIGRKARGKRPLGRPRRRWIDNIKMDLSEIGVSVLDWIGLAQDRYRWRTLVNSVMNLRVP
jgi:hypothetical protein